MRVLLGLLPLAGLAATPALADDHSVWRLFVADHAAPLVTAIDLDSGSPLASFPLEGPAALHTTASGAAVYAVEGSANRVSAIASGITVEDHGDHGDLHVAPPQAVDAAIAGDRPVHFVAHDGRIALFFDGEGVARLVDETAWLDGAPDPLTVASPAPHHGVAASWGDAVLISEPHPDDAAALPVGIRIVDSAGVAGALHACPDLHGEASSGNMLAIACATGLLTVTGAGTPEITLLPYDAALPEGKVTTLIGGVGMQYFLGNFGADRVVVIDPSAAPAFRPVELPTRRVHFAVDPQRVRFAYVFTEDGRLHELDVFAAAITRSVQLTEPYSMDGEWSLPRPRIAVAGGDIAVTDPLQGEVLIVDAESFEVERVLEVAGVPFDIVAIGGSGDDHAH